MGVIRKSSIYIKIYKYKKGEVWVGSSSWEKGLEKYRSQWVMQRHWKNVLIAFGCKKMEEASWVEDIDIGAIWRKAWD